MNNGKKIFLKILLSLTVTTVFMVILSPFYVYRSVTLKLTYCTSMRTAVEIIPMCNNIELEQIIGSKKYILGPAENPKTVYLEIPSDNKLKGLAFQFSRIPSPLKVMAAAILLNGKQIPLIGSGKNIVMTQNKQNIRMSDGIILFKPGKNLNIRLLQDETVRINRRFDPIMALNIFLIALIPAIFVFRKTAFTLTWKNGFDLLYSTAAIILLIIPVMLIDYYGRISDENRYKKDFPDVFSHQRFNFDFPRQFEDWLGDRFTGRKAAIRNERKIFTPACETSGSKDAMPGKDNWMFSKGWNSVEMYQNKNRFTEEQLKTCAEKVTFLNNYFQQRNAKLYIVLSPDKERVYPEYYPPQYKKAHPESRLEQLSGYLSRHTAVRIICPLDSLLNLKKQYPMYFKTGSHWTYRAAHASACMLLQEIKKDFSSLPMEQPNAEKWKKTPCADTDIARQLGYTNPHEQLPQEILLYDEPVRQDLSRYRKLEDESTADLVVSEYTAKAPRPGSIRIFACTDSFWGYAVDFMFPAANGMLHAFFGNGLKFELDMLKNTIDEYHPDVVVIESTERFLDRFLTINIDGD